MRQIDLRAEPLTPSRLRAAMPRAEQEVGDVAAAVTTIIDDVRERGESALIDQARQFDHVEISSVSVPKSQIDQAVADLPAPILAAIEASITRVRAATAAQLRDPVVTEFDNDSRVIQRWRPVRRVGLYVPGGKAVYPSSVVMNVVPAQVAGVEHIALASPAQSEFGGRVHPLILGAAGVLGVEEIYAMGGAGAIGAFAYGVGEIGLEPVDVITGPGNVFVAAAKREVKSVCGIDAEAGPTEIMVIADSTADPEFVAADLLSQAEHDELAGSVLVTDDETFADRVAAALDRRLSMTRNIARASAALKGQQSAIILVASIDDAVTVANAYAAEHLEIQTSNPRAVAEQIDNAGAIFLGPYSPVSLGDYASGSNHVLPTGGQARYAAALGAYSFLRPQQLIEYSQEGLAELADHIVDFSRAEFLPAHGEAVTARVERS